MANGSAHTRAVKMAQDDLRKVIDSFKNEPPFMAEEISARTRARRARIEQAPADIRGLLDRGYSQEFVLRLLDAQEG
jgi:hypothetical protein